MPSEKRPRRSHATRYSSQHSLQVWPKWMGTINNLVPWTHISSPWVMSLVLITLILATFYCSVESELQNEPFQEALE